MTIDYEVAGRDVVVTNNSKSLHTCNANIMYVTKSDST